MQPEDSVCEGCHLSVFATIWGFVTKVLSHLFVQLRKFQHDDGEGRKVEESVHFPFTALNILSVVHTSCHGQAPSIYDCISNNESKRSRY